MPTRQATYTPRPTSTPTATPAAYAIDLHYDQDPEYRPARTPPWGPPTPGRTPWWGNQAVPHHIERQGAYTDLLTPGPTGLTPGPSTTMRPNEFYWTVDYWTRTPTPRPGHAPDRPVWAVWFRWDDGRWPERGGWAFPSVMVPVIYEQGYGPTATPTPYRTPTRVPTRTLTPSKTITPGGPTLTPSRTPTNVPCDQIPPGAPIPCNTVTPTRGGPTFTRTPTRTATVPAPPPTVTPAPGCAGRSGPTALCLDQRFLVSSVWTKPDGTTGPGQAVALTPDTGYFWFFSATNVEEVVKILDGCAINGRYWYFAAGLTNVKVETTVTDTVTGFTKTYTNPQSTAFAPQQDTSMETCGMAAAPLHARLAQPQPTPCNCTAIEVVRRQPWQVLVLTAIGIAFAVFWLRWRRAKKENDADKM